MAEHLSDLIERGNLNPLAKMNPSKLQISQNMAEHLSDLIEQGYFKPIGKDEPPKLHISQNIAEPLSLTLLSEAILNPLALPLCPLFM